MTYSANNMLEVQLVEKARLAGSSSAKYSHSGVFFFDCQKLASCSAPMLNPLQVCHDNSPSGIWSCDGRADHKLLKSPEMRLMTETSKFTHCVQRCQTHFAFFSTF